MAVNEDRVGCVKWGWVVVLCSFLVLSLNNGIMVAGFSILYGDIVNTFSSTTAAVGWVMSAYMITSHGISLLATPFVTRFGCRKLCAIGSLIGGLAVSTSGFAPNLYVLYLAYGVCGGLGSGLAMYTSMLMPQFYFNKNRALAGGLVVVGISFGVVAFSPLVEYWATIYGWRGALILNGGLLMQGVLCAQAYRDPPNMKKPDTQDLATKETEMVDMNKNNKLCDSVINVELVGDDENLKKQVIEYKDVTVSERLISQNGVTRRSIEDIFCGNSELTSSEAENLENSVLSEGTAAEHCSQHSLVEEADSSKLEHEKSSSSSKNSERLQEGQLDAKLTKEEEATPDLHQREEDRCHVVWEYITEVLDFSLLTDPVILLYIVGSGLVNFGVFTAYAHIPNMARHEGLDEAKAAMLSAIYGAGSMFGLIIMSIIANLNCVNKIAQYALSGMFGGVLLLGVCLCQTYTHYAFVSGAYGFSLGTFVCVQMTSTRDLVGLERFSRAVSLLLASVGLSACTAVPFAGWLFDMSNNYHVPFLVNGLVQVFGGALVTSSLLLRHFRQKPHLYISQLTVTAPA